MKILHICSITALLAVSATPMKSQTLLSSWSLSDSLDATMVDSSLASASALSFTNLNNLGFDGIGIEFDGMPAFPAKTDYVSVTMTAQPGEQINLSGGSVSFDADYLNGSRSSDGYSVEVISDPAGAATALELGTSEDGDMSFDSGTIPGFTPANEVELRVYWNNGESWGDQQMGNLVVSVPEPSTMAALTGLLSMGLVLWHRRRR